QVRGVVLFKGGLRGKARDFNWHNVVGVWSVVPLFIVVLSALPMSFSWANAAVYRVVGDRLPAPAGGRERAPGREHANAPLSLDGLNQLMARAQQQEPAWRTINLRIPT